MQKISALVPFASCVVVTTEELSMGVLKKLVALGVVAHYSWGIDPEWRDRLERVASKLLSG